MQSEHGSSRIAVTIYHNPACSNSRITLTLIRNAGLEPTVIEYLKKPPDRATLLDLLAKMGAGPRDILRQKEPRYAELGLRSPEMSDEQLIEAMLANPVLINRPIVVTPLGVKLCRPPEVVLDLLPPAHGRSSASISPM